MIEHSASSCSCDRRDGLLPQQPGTPFPDSKDCDHGHKFSQHLSLRFLNIDL